MEQVGLSLEVAQIAQETFLEYVHLRLIHSALTSRPLTILPRRDFLNQMWTDGSPYAVEGSLLWVVVQKKAGMGLLLRGPFTLGEEVQKTHKYTWAPPHHIWAGAVWDSGPSSHLPKQWAASILFLPNMVLIKFSLNPVVGLFVVRT